MYIVISMPKRISVACGVSQRISISLSGTPERYRILAVPQSAHSGYLVANCAQAGARQEWLQIQCLAASGNL
jgi:hypothetical protein